MKKPGVTAALIFLVLLTARGLVANHGGTGGLSDPCDSYGDCASASLSYLRANPDDSLYLGDRFAISLGVTPGTGTIGCGAGCTESWEGLLAYVSWSYDHSAMSANLSESSARFIVVSNGTAIYVVSGTANFVVTITTCATDSSGKTACSHSSFPSPVTVSEDVRTMAFVLSFQTRLVNVTDKETGYSLRNPDGTFYRNDSFCDSWNAKFQFASDRADIKINVTSESPPSLKLLNYSSGLLGRTGRFCYEVSANSSYAPFTISLAAKALNWEWSALGFRQSGQPFAVVQYNPAFTSYAYMMYRNSTASSSYQRPWVLLVRYEGNLPGYSYDGDGNTHSFNGSATLSERAFFGDFRYSTLSYQPYSSGGVLDFHPLNSTGTVQYDWLNKHDSSPLYYGNRIEKYLFNVTATSISPILSHGHIYLNITMLGCWQQEHTCDLTSNYWLVPFLWSGRLNVLSVDSLGNEVPTMPIALTIRDSAPLDAWLTRDFQRVFGNDPKGLEAFAADLYPTNQTMTISGEGKLSIVLNQTSLAPPLISTTAGGVTLSGNFTFTPVCVNTAIRSIPNSLKGTIFYANATIPLWSYNMVQGSLAYLPIATTIDHPTTFLELVNSSSGWIAGNTTAPQTPSAFASQQYGFWPMGENLTLYVNTQGGGVNLLGTQKIGPDEYRASFYIEPWSGGISSIQLVEGNETWAPQSTLNAGSYPSPLPAALTGLYSVTFPSTGQDMKVVLTNVWGATTTVDLGSSLTPARMNTNLIPVTTAAAFGVGVVTWLVVDGILRARRTSTHE